MATEEEKYIAVSGRLHYAGGGRLWIVDPARGRVLEAPEEAGPLLRAADRFRTLREHRKALLEMGWQDDGSGSLDALLASLVGDGILRSRREVLGRIQEAPPEAPPPPVSAITWITCDRPQLLRRSVQSAIVNLRQYGHQVDLRVYDDSADAQARRATRAMLAELGRREGFAVRYAGAEEKRAFASALKERAPGVAAETIEFALFDPLRLGYTNGANFNASLLDTCGRMVVHADDDSVFLCAVLPQTAAGLRLSSAADPTERRFFADRQQRERGAQPHDVDLLAAHQTLLGRSAGACLRQFGGQADCAEAAPEFLPVLESGARVAVTMAGMCGDSGQGSPLSVLWLTGTDREAALASEQGYRCALRSREILRAVPCATLSQGAFLMSNHCGLDNRLALPPFFPALRNADGVFGQLLNAGQPRHLIAHLREAVLHLPGEQRVFSGEPRVQPRLSDLLMLLVRSLAAASWTEDPQRGMLAIGGGLVDAGRLPPAAFAGLLRELWAAEASHLILALELLLQEHGGRPEFWAADAEAWIERVRRLVGAQEPLVPADLADRGGGWEAVGFTQRLVRDYGELLLAWPELRAGSVWLASDGMFLARPQQME
jgi:hypothetical protein